MIPPPPLPLPLSHRFGVFFFTGGAQANPLDVRFQKVSGLRADIDTHTVNEGGQNLYTQKLPRRVSYGNLVLERGFVVGSLLNLQFNVAMSTMKFVPSNVIVTLFAESAAPLAAWMFMKAWPVRWATDDLNAAEDRVLIDTLELAYTQMVAMRL